MVAAFLVYDKNGDGELTADELPARMQGLIARGDKNHDGKLSAEEIRALAEAQTAPAGPPQQGPPRGNPMFTMDPLLNALDTNHDGVISADEIRNATISLKTLDANGDGQITADEMRQRQQSGSWTNWQRIWTRWAAPDKVPVADQG